MVAQRLLNQWSGSSKVLVAVLSVAGLVTGCAPTQQSSGTPTASSIAPLPPYQDPGSIRPSDSSVNPNPVAAPVAPAPSAALSTAKATGPWAPPVPSRTWKYIVLHHSASPSGNASVFDREHKDKGWDELGYHFVIDNGQGGPDGRIEIGPRWRKQKWGAHAKTPDNKYNNFGIGICFVGNFENSRPTAKQLASAARLVSWLEQTYKIPSTNIIGHEDTGRSTLCPGKFLQVARVRTLAGAQVASLASGEAFEFPLTSHFGEDEGTAETAMHARVAAAPTEVELLQSR